MTFTDGANSVADAVGRSLFDKCDERRSARWRREEHMEVMVNVTTRWSRRWLCHAA